jgi:hypothetical protein
LPQQTDLEDAACVPRFEELFDHKTARWSILAPQVLQSGAAADKTVAVMPTEIERGRAHRQYASCVEMNTQLRLMAPTCEVVSLFRGVPWLRAFPIGRAAAQTIEEMKMRTKRCLIPPALTLLLCVAVAQTKPNFSGEWKMNAAKSDFGQMPAPTSLVLKIAHSDPELKVARTQVSERGEFTSESAYTTDGKECVNKTRFGESKSTLKWEGNALVIATKMDFQGNEVTITEKWSLSDDGKTLTQNRHFSSSQGEGDAKTVLEKQ